MRNSVDGVPQSCLYNRPCRGQAVWRSNDSCCTSMVMKTDLVCVSALSCIKLMSLIFLCNTGVSAWYAMPHWRHFYVQEFVQFTKTSGIPKFKLQLLQVAVKKRVLETSCGKLLMEPFERKTPESSLLIPQMFHDVCVCTDNFCTTIFECAWLSSKLPICWGSSAFREQPWQGAKAAGWMGQQGVSEMCWGAQCLSEPIWNFSCKIPRLCFTFTRFLRDVLSIAHKIQF